MSIIVPRPVDGDEPNFSGPKRLRKITRQLINDGRYDYAENALREWEASLNRFEERHRSGIRQAWHDIQRGRKRMVLNDDRMEMV